MLFLAVGLFVLYLVITVVAGIAKFVLTALIVVLLVAFAVNVLRRR